jgi:hypothetical protein
MKCWILFALPIFVACLYIAIMFYKVIQVQKSNLFIKFLPTYKQKNFDIIMNNKLNKIHG